MGASGFGIRESGFAKSDAPRKSVGHYRELEVWTVAMELVDAIYQLARKLPATEKFGLIPQLQRAAVSVPANIAEGNGRTARGDYRRHLAIARGSLFELQTLLEITVRCGFLTRQAVSPAWKLSERTGQMLTKMLQRVKD